MLNKEVCKTCVESFVRSHYSQALTAEMQFNWTDQDDDKWDRLGSIECPYSVERWESVEVDNGTMPITCIHKFEHTVAAGMKNVK